MRTHDPGPRPVRAEFTRTWQRSLRDVATGRSSTEMTVRTGQHDSRTKSDRKNREQIKAKDVASDLVISRHDVPTMGLRLLYGSALQSP